MSIVANTGRRTQISASFCISFAFGNQRCVSVSLWRAIPTTQRHGDTEVAQRTLLLDGHPIDELIEIAGCYQLIGSYSGFYFNQISFSKSELDGTLLSAPIFHDKNATRSSLSLY